MSAEGPRTGPVDGAGQSAGVRGQVLGQACQNRRTALHEAVSTHRGRLAADAAADVERIGADEVTALADLYYEWLQIPLGGGPE